MKTKEELNALKEEVETLNKKLAELTEEELAEVTGGSKPNPKELGPKYQKDTQVKFYAYGWIPTIGTIQAVEWCDSMNQYAYRIDHNGTRYILPNVKKEDQVNWLKPGTDFVKEEDIIYDL